MGFMSKKKFLSEEEKLPEEYLKGDAAVTSEYEKMVREDEKQQLKKERREYATLDAKNNDLAIRTIKTLQNVAHLAGFSIKGPLILIDDKTKIRWK